MSSWNFYLPQYQPTGLTGLVGGSIAAEELTTAVDALFPAVLANSGEDHIQYRKVFIKNDSSDSFQNVYVEVENIEYTGQIKFAILHEGGDPTGTAPDPMTLPDIIATGQFTGFYGAPITGLGTGNPGDTIGVWLQQFIPANSDNEVLASFVLQVRASKL